MYVFTLESVNGMKGIWVETSSLGEISRFFAPIVHIGIDPNSVSGFGLLPIPKMWTQLLRDQYGNDIAKVGVVWEPVSTH